ncbi:hypothetical protein [Celeribacter sp.]|uniref:hypothetical protein n=1 Tax=Celeribacter sp. TaxID=1890673 RepID=UPI003A955B19
MDIIVACTSKSPEICKKIKSISKTLYNVPLTQAVNRAHFSILHSNSAQTFENKDTIVALAGYHSSQPQDVLETAAQALDAAPKPLNEQLSIGGVHSLIATRRDQLVAWASIPASGTLYYTCMETGIVISNRPKLLALLVAAEIDPSYISYALTVGYPIDDTTPYMGVKALLAGYAIHAQGNQVHIVRRRLSKASNAPKKPEDKLTAEENFRKELVRACSVVTRYKQPELRLSGGKDSRLIVSALFAGGYKVICHARGQGEDAEIAETIARKLKFEFKNTIPKPLDAVAFEEGVRTSLKLSDGFVETEAHVGLTIPFKISERQDAILYGHSHLQKGGFARTMAASDKEYALDFLKKAVVPEYIQQSERENLLGKLEEIISMFKYKAPIDILYAPYAVLRAGRYLEPLYLKTASAYVPVYPLNDERMYIASGRVCRAARTNETIVYNTINKNAPQLEGMPLCEDKWRFQPANMLPKPKVNEANFATESTPNEFRKMVQMARERVKDSSVLDLAKTLLDPEIIGKCGLGEVTDTDNFKFLNRHAAKLIMRMYFLQTLIDTWEHEKSLVLT